MKKEIKAIWKIIIKSFAIWLAIVLIGNLATVLCFAMLGISRTSEYSDRTVSDCILIVGALFFSFLYFVIAAKIAFQYMMYQSVKIKLICFAYCAVISEVVRPSFFFFWLLLILQGILFLLSDYIFR